MLEFAAVQGLDDRDSESASLVRAFFANLLAGLEDGHIKKSSAVHVMEALYDLAEDYLQEYGDPHRPANDFSELHVDRLRSMITEVMQADLDSANFLTRRGPVAVNGAATAITLQPSWAFKFWLDEKRVLGLDRRDHSPAEVIVFCEEFQKGVTRKEGAAIGMRHNVVWLTPYIPGVREVIEESLKHKPKTRERAASARRLRELLGLIDRGPGEQAVIAWTRKSLDEMSKQRRVKLSAPTILDSRGYRRFRHWPPNGGTGSIASDGYGRTYELDRDERVRSSSNHGAPEIVRRQLQPSEVARLEYVGKIHAMVGEDDRVAIAEAACDYADEICQGRSSAELLGALERLIGC